LARGPTHWLYMIDRPEVLLLLGRQHWVADIAQLLELGVSARTLARARRAQLVAPILPGVVHLSAAPLTFDSRAMALQLYAGAPSYISHHTAARILGVRGMPEQPVKITVPQNRHLTLPRWARSERSSWIDDDLDVVERPDGLRVAHPLRMLFGLAGHFSRHRLERAAEDAWHLGLLRPDDAADYLQRIRRSGRGGVARYERWVDQAIERSRPSQSGFEVDVARAVTRAGLPVPERQFELTLPTGERIHIDLAWPSVRLGVEPGHSWWHGGDLQMERDAARDRACDMIGWRIMRYSESARADLAAVGREIAAVYRDREHSLRSA
jgi:very-short-patch-repair endonuclease